MTRLARVGLVLLLGGCSVINDAGQFRVGDAATDAPPSQDGGPLDGGERDAGADDAGADAALSDAASTDAEPADSGASDGGPSDGGPSDGGPSDAAIDGGCGCEFEPEDQVLTSTCVDGVCVIESCQSGYADCDMLTSTGCEVDTTSDVMHCGGCGVSCDADTSCRNSICDPHVQVSVGGGHTCVVRESGTLACWGRNLYEDYTGSLNTWYEQPTTITSSIAGGGPVHVREVAAGNSFTCIISDEVGSEGSVYCRGEGARNRLGTGNTTDQPDFVPVMQSDTVTPLPVVRTLTSFANHSCAIDLSDNLWCWGASTDGAAGTFASDGPVTMISSDVAEVVTSNDSTCFRTNAGAVRCLGNNNAGQLGNGAATTFTTSTPVDVVDVSDTAITNARALVRGGGEYCLIDGANDLRCWGWNANEAIEANTGRVTRATLVASSVVQAVMPNRAICWWNASGQATCRGLRERGAYGDGPFPTSSAEEVDTRAPALDGLLDPTTGVNVSCGFRGGEVLCWGYSVFGEAPRDSLIEAPAAPMRDADASASTWDVVALGANRGCGVRAGSLYCWGSGGSGQHGDGSNDSGSAPRPATNVNAVGTVLDVALSGAGSCAAVQGAGGNRLVCWSSNTAGATAGAPSGSPSVIVGVDAAEVAMGYLHGCALVGPAPNHQVMCWGKNDQGQVTLPASATAPPTTIMFGASPLEATALALGDDHSCAIEAGTREVVCWGRNDLGQLGRGTEVDADFAPDRAGITNAVALTAGTYHTCAIQDGGALWCWGRGDYRQRIPSSSSSSGTPARVTVPSLAGAVAVAAGIRSTCAAFDDGDVYCWGFELNAQLGSPQSSRPRAPVVVPGVSGTDTVVAFSGDIGGFGNAFCAGIAGGEFGCWGDNTYGKLATDPGVMMPPTTVTR